MSKKILISLLFLTSNLLVPLTALGMELQKTSSPGQATPTQQALQELAQRQQAIICSVQKAANLELSYNPLVSLFNQKDTALLKAKISEHPQPQELKQLLLTKACRLNDHRFIEFLHNGIIDINSPITLLSKSLNNITLTPLHIACETSNIKTIKFILKLGANIEAQNSLGSTPLHMACETGREDVVQLLIKEKANIYAKDCYEYTPFHVACQKGHVAIAKLLRRYKADIHDTRNNKGNALCLAAHFGHYEMAQFLINEGARILDSMEGNNTTLHYACIGGNPKIVKIILSQKPALINIQLEKGITPLHIACALQNRAIIEVLLKYGAVIDIQDEKSLLPIDYALHTKNAEIIEMLEKHGAYLLKEHQAEEAMRTLLVEINQSSNKEKSAQKIKTMKKKKKKNTKKKATSLSAAQNEPTTNDPSNSNIEIALIGDQSTPKNEVTKAQDRPSQEPTHTAYTEPLIIQTDSLIAPKPAQLSKPKPAAKEDLSLSSVEKPIPTTPEYEIFYAKNIDWPRSLYGKTRDRLIEDMRMLRNGSAGLDIKLLKSRTGFRLRSGKYRIIYTKDEIDRKIYIHEIGHRKNVYK